ncbi:MAG: hypothetical protein ED557_05650 [Balneola sp.]|nr:MAG: hypothetical protein ED557_05650 [Balneola sp.]
MKRHFKPNNGSPRYVNGKYPNYDRTYNHLKENSVIFNEELRSKRESHSAVMTGIGECRNALAEWEGNSQGYYVVYDRRYEALLPIAKKGVLAVVNEFNIWRNQQVKNGYAIETPSTWPKDLLDRKLKAEALLDIRYAEIKALKDRIEALIQEKEKKKKQGILPNGPQGRTTQANENEPITAMDGQGVSYSDQGIPFINEESSPYHGMSVFHYRQMCKEWRKEVGITPAQLVTKAEEIFLEQKQIAKEEGIEPPLFPPVTSEFKLPEWIKRLGITKKDWPKWPEGVKPIKNISVPIAQI